MKTEYPLEHIVPPPADDLCPDRKDAPLDGDFPIEGSGAGDTTNDAKIGTTTTTTTTSQPPNQP